MSVMSMANDKTPGPDGFTSKFYKKFWMDLQIPLYVPLLKASCQTMKDKVYLSLYCELGKISDI